MTSELLLVTRGYGNVWRNMIVKRKKLGLNNGLSGAARRLCMRAQPTTGEWLGMCLNAMIKKQVSRNIACVCWGLCVCVCVCSLRA